MSELNDRPSLQSDPNRRIERRVPASTLGAVTTRVVGGAALTLLNYTSNGLLGQSPSRLLVGSRISVRLATATLNAVVAGRVVRASLTQIVEGVPRYEVAVQLDHDVDWAGAAGRKAAERELEQELAAEVVAVQPEESVAVEDDVTFEQDQESHAAAVDPMAASPSLALVRWVPPEETHGVAVEDVPLSGWGEEAG